MTSKVEVFERALSKMREYEFATITEEVTFALLEPYLVSAETEFGRICTQPLARGEDGYYSVVLDPICVEILALGVLTYWLSTYVYDADKLRNALGTKDYSLFSPANLLSAVENVRNTCELQFRSKMYEYSYVYGNLLREGKVI